MVSAAPPGSNDCFTLHRVTLTKVVGPNRLGPENYSTSPQSVASSERSHPAPGRSAEPVPPFGTGELFNPPREKVGRRRNIAPSPPPRLSFRTLGPWASSPCAEG